MPTPEYPIIYVSQWWPLMCSQCSQLQNNSIMNILIYMPLCRCLRIPLLKGKKLDVTLLFLLHFWWILMNCSLCSCTNVYSGLECVLPNQDNLSQAQCSRNPLLTWQDFIYSTPYNT